MVREQILRYDRRVGRRGEGPPPSPPYTEGEQFPPWPRDDGVPFDATAIGNMVNPTRAAVLDLPKRDRMGDWGIKESVLYNAWLKVIFRPTRFPCSNTLQTLGINNAVDQMMERIGVRGLYEKYPVYPELCMQFFASVEMGRLPESLPYSASEYYIYFMIKGRRYHLSIEELCKVYGFNAQHEGVHLPSTPYTALWNAIGSTPPGRSQERKISRIRNPVLRIVAKILGHTFFGKGEVGAVTNPMLSMLHLGMPEEAYALYGSSQPRRTVNLGYIFAEVLMKKKTRVLKRGGIREEYIGSMLTPLFKECGIVLMRELRAAQLPDIDSDYLRLTHTLRGDDHTYEYTDRAGVIRFCRLPLPELAEPCTLAALEFDAPDIMAIPTLTDSSDSDEYVYEPVPIPNESREFWQARSEVRHRRFVGLLKARKRMKAMAQWLACGAPPRAQTDGPGSSSAAPRRGDC